MLSRNAVSIFRVRILTLLAACVLLQPLGVSGQESETTPATALQEVEVAKPAVNESSDPPDQLLSSHQYTGQWSARVDDLIYQIVSIQKNESDADELYLDLGRAIRIRLSILRRTLKGARSPLDNIAGIEDLPATVRTIDDLHASVESMYAARIRLLDFITPALHLEVTATDVFGVEELAVELRFIWLQIRFQALFIPAASLELWHRVRIAPLPIVWRILEFILAIVFFRWWRRWLPETLRKMRASLTEIRPRSTTVLRRIKTIWYIDQLRRPLEWLILFSVMFALIDMEGVNYITDILSIIIRWILLGWFAVSLLNAVAARGDAGLAGENARLRQRSLQLAATWLVLLGLSLDVANSLAGTATLHAWVWRLFQILAVPVLFVLLSWWRKSIFERLERELESSDSVERMLRHQTGLRSYTSAASGAVRLLANTLRRSLLRNILRLGSDQGFASSLVTGKSDSGIGVTQPDPVAALPEPLRKKLMAHGEFYDRFARSERREIINRAKQEQSGVIAITGERGIGMSTLLARITESLDGRMILLDCLGKSYDELAHSLGEALGVRNVNSKNVSQKLEDSGIHAIAIDNLHRLVRPVMGGQKDLAKLSELIEGIHVGVLWIFSVDCFAWQFMRRARADRSTIGEAIELRSWSEEQIAELLDMRNTEAGIDADFSNAPVPPEFMETAMDTVEERNKAGVFRMICAMAGGNPSVALRIWADSIYPDESGRLLVRAPVQLRSRELDKAAPNLLLVLRAIAQWEVISEKDIAGNLRLPPGAVGSAIHYSLQRGWIEESQAGYRLAWRWFRTIIRVLLRQNLLAR